MKPENNIVYWIQYLTISFILELQENIFFHVQSDNHMRINNSDNRKHMFDLTTQANNSTLQAGLIAITMKLHTLSIINGTMIENVTISQQN